MPYSMHLLLALATLPASKSAMSANGEQSEQADVQDVITPVLEKVLQLVEQFRQQRVTPLATYCFEQQLQEEVRELGRVVAQWTYQQLEAGADSLAKHVRFEASHYTRRCRRP